MSRIGKLPIPVPAGVEVKIDGSTVSVKGPKGELTETFNNNMAISMNDDNQVIVERPNDERQNRALHGLTRSLINNMVIGVTRATPRRSSSSALAIVHRSRATNLK